ncbi:MAG TPA: AraC family transcriptional regulator [Verrucomicrobiae bacterium]|nr:AraC family transcriptional regulator [Verrucomicrobiae bacterium]
MGARSEEFFRYLPVSDRTARWGVYLTGCGHVRVSEKGEHPPLGHPELYRFRWEQGRVLPEYQFIYLTRGQGVFETAAAGTQALRAGDLIVLFPGMWHRYRPASGSPWETLWIGLDGDHVHRLVAQGFLAEGRPLIHVGANKGLRDAYLRLLEVVRGENEVNPLLLAAYAMEILAWILAPSQPEAPRPATAPFAKPVRDRFVAEAVRFIWSHGQPELAAAEVAAHLPIARRSLERRFQRVLGHTILEEILRCRLERARRLLAETDMPLKAIAFAAGFSCAERMSKVFRRAEGISPAEYRRRRA